MKSREFLGSLSNLKSLVKEFRRLAVPSLIPDFLFIFQRFMGLASGTVNVHCTVPCYRK